MPEWPIGPDSKSGVRVSVPWVRIPPSPPVFKKVLYLKWDNNFYLCFPQLVPRCKPFLGGLAGTIEMMTAYHGTSHEIGGIIVKSKSYKMSKGDQHWLGDGVYFFLESIFSRDPSKDAAQWAKLSAYDKQSRSYRYNNYVVIKNSINSCRIWDLSTEDGAEIFLTIKEKITDKIMAAKKSIKYGPLDGVIINYALNEIPAILFDAVKNNLFIKLSAEERINRIGLSQPNCTVLAVRNESVINVIGVQEEGTVS